MASAVKIVKLTNGEELVGKVTVSKDNKRVSVENAVRFILQQDGIGMMPYIPLTSDKTIEFDAKMVLCYCTLEDEVLNAYNAKHGSGILVPTLKLQK